MKLYKKELGKVCLITWSDAWTELDTTLVEFLNQGFANKETVGWLEYFDKEKIIICTERSGMRKDLTMIPYGWVKELSFL